MAMQRAARRDAARDEAAQPKIGQPNDTGLGELLEKYGFKIGAGLRARPAAACPGPIDCPAAARCSANVPGLRRRSRSTPTDKDCSVLAGVNAAGLPVRRARSSWSARWRAASRRRASSGRSPRRTPTPGSRPGSSSSRPTTKIEEGKEKGSFGAGLRLPGPAQERLPVAAPRVRDVGARPAGHAAVRIEEAGAAAGGRRLRLRARTSTCRSARYLPIYQEGAQMLFNAISWAIEDEALTPVRTKTLTARPIAGRVGRQRSCALQGDQRRGRARWPSSPSASCAGACAARAARVRNCNRSTPTFRRPHAEPIHEPKNAHRPRRVRRSSASSRSSRSASPQKGERRRRPARARSPRSTPPTSTPSRSRRAAPPPSSRAKAASTR